MTQRTVMAQICALVSLYAIPAARADIIDGLTAYWPLDNATTDEAQGLAGSASSVDDSAGSFAGGAGYDTSNQLFGSGAFLGDGNGSGSLRFANSSDTNGASNNITVSWWGRVDSFDKAWQGGVITGEGNKWRFHRNGNSNTMAWMGGGGDISGSADVDDGDWHHFVGTTNTSGRVLYIDGSQVATGGAATIDPGSPDLWIGNNPDSTDRAWDGGIDDVAIWNRALSAQEVQDIYDAGVAGDSLGDLIGGGNDADGDGLPDAWEIANLPAGADQDDGSVNPDYGANGDPDSDVSDNFAEFERGTDPLDSDSDDDNLLDGHETDTGTYVSATNTGTDPLLADTDSDGLNDGDEVNSYSTDPTLADTDGDGLSDADEVNNQGTNPALADSDGDGAEDGLELIFGTDPNDPADTPPPGSTLVGLSNPGTVGDFLDNALPSQTPAQSSGSSFSMSNALPNLSFGSLKGVVSEPNPDPNDGENYILVIERGGTVQRVAWDSSANSKDQVLSVSVDFGDNGGLRSFVCHPEFNIPGSPNRNYAYAFYSTDAPGNFAYRLSRFTRNESTGDFGNELVMIQQGVWRNNGQHMGGGLVFGLDGFLYCTWGTLELGHNNGTHPDAQRIDRIFQSALIRIDVDKDPAKSDPVTRTLQGNTGSQAMPGTSQSCFPGHEYYHGSNFSGVGYWVPKDNYFKVNPPGPGDPSHPAYPHGPALDEHVALGLRNPWTITVDPVDGDIAWFVVGGNSGPDPEEAEVYVPGGNYGWPYREGDLSATGETTFQKPPADHRAPIYLGVEVDPVDYHNHDLGAIGVGGVIYQGDKLSSLSGTLVWTDHSTGHIWSVDYKDAPTPGDATRTTLLSGAAGGTRQMWPSPDGQDIMFARNGEINVLVDSSPSTPDPPALLSQTGAFTDLSALTPRAGFIPFEPAAKLWSDRAVKKRWIALPNTDGVDGQYDQPSERIIFSENGEYDFPNGTVFVKHFTLPLDEGDPENPDLQKNVETRFLVRGQDSRWYSFSYKWNENDTDAVLLTDGDDPNTVSSTLLVAGSTADYIVPTGPIPDWNTTAGPANLGDWGSGAAGIGYEDSPADYQGMINTTVPPGTTSVYTRFTFNVPDQATLDSIVSLSINVRYDDGFAAWLNGTRVAGENAPANPIWSDTATNDNPDSSAVSFQPIDVSTFISRLQVGDNVLAIQMLNGDSGSSDLLLDPQLVAGISLESGNPNDGTYTITRADDTTYEQTWSFPTRAQCFECHQEPSGTVLGFKSRQLNHAISYPGGTVANQLATLNGLGVFDVNVNASELPTYTTSASIDDQSISLEHRVRSYLDANCAMCHRPGADAGRALFDARLTTELSLTGIVDGVPLAGEFGITDARIVKPGDPLGSVLWHRDAATSGEATMPPLAKSLQDEVYIDVLTQWIERIGFPNFHDWATAGGVIGGVHADDDGDRLSNGFEFLAQLDGMTPNIGFGPTLSVTGGNTDLLLAVEGDAIADGLSPVLKSSINLIDWFPMGDPGSLLNLEEDSSEAGVDGIMRWRFLPGRRGFGRFEGVE